VTARTATLLSRGLLGLAIVMVAASALASARISDVRLTAPIVVGGEKSFELGSSGLPLGMFCDSSFVSTGVRLAPGETLLLFTDGVTEANDATGSEFGTERLRASINGSASGHPTELLQKCVSAVTAFRNGTARNDDLTMLALKYTGAAN